MREESEGPFNVIYVRLTRVIKLFIDCYEFGHIPKSHLTEKPGEKKL